MKIEIEKREILSNINGEQTQFRISNNPIIFDILRNRMYQIPKASCVREICDNARDSMRIAGVKKPIEIIVSDYLVVRDFGVGMSPEHIRDVYIVTGKQIGRAHV